MVARFPAFLSWAEVHELRVLAIGAEGWVAGRQGTGYDSLPLKSERFRAARGLIDRCLAVLGVPFEGYWDAYLIRYRDGAYIPEHVDVAKHGKRHRRINAVITAARAGGELRINDVRIELEVGDALLFFPDREVHAVSPVVGERVLLSVGAWIEPLLEAPVL